MLPMQGQPFVCWGTETELALFRCLSSEVALPVRREPRQKVTACPQIAFSSLQCVQPSQNVTAHTVCPVQDLIAAVYASGLPSPVLLKQGSVGDVVLADPRPSEVDRCRMSASLLLPLFDSSDRKAAVGVFEVARTTSQPLMTYAFLASLAACFQVNLPYWRQHTVLFRFTADVLIWCVAVRRVA